MHCQTAVLPIILALATLGSAKGNYGQVSSLWETSVTDWTHTTIALTTSPPVQGNDENPTTHGIDAISTPGPIISRPDVSTWNARSLNFNTSVSSSLSFNNSTGPKTVSSGAHWWSTSSSMVTVQPLSSDSPSNTPGMTCIRHIGGVTCLVLPTDETRSSVTVTTTMPTPTAVEMPVSATSIFIDGQSSSWAPGYGGAYTTDQIMSSHESSWSSSSDPSDHWTSSPLPIDDMSMDTTVATLSPSGSWLSSISQTGDMSTFDPALATTVDSTPWATWTTPSPTGPTTMITVSSDYSDSSTQDGNGPSTTAAPYGYDVSPYGYDVPVYGTPPADGHSGYRCGEEYGDDDGAESATRYGDWCSEYHLDSRSPRTRSGNQFRRWRMW